MGVGVRGGGKGKEWEGAERGEDGEGREVGEEGGGVVEHTARLAQFLHTPTTGTVTRCHAPQGECLFGVVSRDLLYVLVLVGVGGVKVGRYGLGTRVKILILP